MAQQPNDIPALVQLAHLYGYRGEEDQAIVLYERAVRADPTRVVAATNLGTYLIKKGRATRPCVSGPTSWREAPVSKSRG